jgi:murein DD-endopeptidase MepM/ murein hydrolase activator NlpD
LRICHGASAPTILQHLLTFRRLLVCGSGAADDARGGLGGLAGKIKGGFHHATAAAAPRGAVQRPDSAERIASLRSRVFREQPIMQLLLALLVPLTLYLAGTSQVSACEGADGASQLGYQSPSAGAVDGGFGPRVDPITGNTRMHTGVDYFAPLGDPVKAAQAGTVAEAGRNGGYGLRIVIRHARGIATAYAHLQSMKVAPGDCVAKGDVIGAVGKTGLTTPGRGPHLHFEVLSDGAFVDPIRFLASPPQ